MSNTEHNIPESVGQSDVEKAMEPLYALLNITGLHIYDLTATAESIRLTIPAVDEPADWDTRRPPTRLGKFSPQANPASRTLMQRVDITVTIGGESE